MESRKNSFYFVDNLNIGVIGNINETKHSKLDVTFKDYFVGDFIHKGNHYKGWELLNLVKDRLESTEKRGVHDTHSSFSSNHVMLLLELYLLSPFHYHVLILFPNSICSPSALNS